MIPAEALARRRSHFKRPLDDKAKFALLALLDALRLRRKLANICDVNVRTIERALAGLPLQINSICSIRENLIAIGYLPEDE